MDTSIFIARILAVVYLSAAVGFLLSADYYKKVLPKLLNDPTYFLMGGMMAIVLGFFMITYHNFWVKDWTVIITVFGWIALIKGIFLVALPTSFDVFKPMFTPANMTKIWGPLVLIVGLFFGYFGFIA